jgi:hypothetical protein
LVELGFKVVKAVSGPGFRVVKAMLAGSVRKAIRVGRAVSGLGFKVVRVIRVGREMSGRRDRTRLWPALRVIRGTPVFRVIRGTLVRLARRGRIRLWPALRVIRERPGRLELEFRVRRVIKAVRGTWAQLVLVSRGPREMWGDLVDLDLKDHRAELAYRVFRAMMVSGRKVARAA